LLLIGLAAVPVAHAIPPPPERLTVNCEEPVYASDQLVCEDPELLAIDRRMGLLLEQLDLGAVEISRPTLEPQAYWFRRRSLCAFSDAHRACLRAMYIDRLVVLEALRNEENPQD
jgi:uncharacterized protein